MFTLKGCQMNYVKHLDLINYGKQAVVFTESLVQALNITAQKMKFSITDFFSKSDPIRRKLRIWSHLLKKSLMENFIFCAVHKFLRLLKCDH